MSIYERINYIINNSNALLAKSDALELHSWCVDNVESNYDILININELLSLDDTINNKLIKSSLIENVRNLNKIYYFDELLPFDIVKNLYTIPTVTIKCRSYLYYGYTMDGALKYNGNRDVKYYIPRRSELMSLFDILLKGNIKHKINHINYINNHITYVEYVNNVLKIINGEKYIVENYIEPLNERTKGELQHIVNELNQRGYNFEMINDCNTVSDIEKTFKNIKDTFFYNSYSKIDIYGGRLVVRYRDNVKSFTVSTPLQFDHSEIDYKIHLLYIYVLSSNFKYSFGFVDDINKTSPGKNVLEEQIPERYKIMYLSIIDELEKRGLLNYLFRKDNTIYNSSLKKHLSNILDIFNNFDEVVVSINGNSQRLVCASLNYTSRTVHHNSKSHTYIIELLYDYINSDEYQDYHHNSPHDIILDEGNMTMLMNIQTEAIRRGYKPPLTHQSIAFAVWSIHQFFRWDEILPSMLKENTYSKNITNIIDLLYNYINSDEYKKHYIEKKNIFKRMFNK